jgi:hypothetical protein
LRVLRGSGKDEHVCRGVGDCGGSGRVTLETVQTLSLLGLYCKFAERTTARVSTGYWNVAYVLAGTVSRVSSFPFSPFSSLVSFALLLTKTRLDTSFRT